MRERGPRRRSLRTALAVVLACAVLVGCSDDDESDEAGSDDDSGAVGAADVGGAVEPDHAQAVAELAELLPADTRGVFSVDIGALVSGDSSAEVEDLLRGEGGDPAIGELFGAVASLARAVDVPDQVTSALLAQTTDAADGLFLLARTRDESIEGVAVGSAPAPSGTYGPESRAVYVDDHGNHLALLPGRVLVVGTASVVESVVEIADGSGSGGPSAIAPYFEALDPTPT